jgi:hypothetical protein
VAKIALYVPVPVGTTAAFCHVLPSSPEYWISSFLTTGRS